jgi:hypothetical protein
MNLFSISPLIVVATMLLSLLSPADTPHERERVSPIPQTANMYIKIKDDRFAWATGEQIPVIAYGWSGDTLMVPTDNEQVRPFVPRAGGQPLLTIRKFQDEFSDDLQEAFEHTVRFKSVFFTVSWPGGDTYEYRLQNAKIVAIRSMATGMINAQSYEEIGLAFDTIERVTDDSGSE